MIKWLKLYIDMLKLQFPKIFHFGCNALIINLVVQEGLKFSNDYMVELEMLCFELMQVALRFNPINKFVKIMDKN